MLLNILVAHDLGPIGDNALAWAAELARSTGGRVAVLHVIPLIAPTLTPVPVAPPPPEPEDIEGFRRLLGEACARNKLADAVTEVLVAPNTGEAVLAFAKQREANLIVMGTHGRGVVSRALLGSVADYVVRHAEVPVVTLRAHKP